MDKIKHRWADAGFCIYCRTHRTDIGGSSYCDFLNRPGVRSVLPTANVQAKWITCPGGAVLRAANQWLARIVLEAGPTRWVWELNNRNLVNHEITWGIALERTLGYLAHDPVERYYIVNPEFATATLKQVHTNMQTVPRVVVDATKAAAKETLVKAREAKTALRLAQESKDKAQQIFDGHIKDLLEIVDFLDAQHDCKPPALYHTWKAMLVDPVLKDESF